MDRSFDEQRRLERAFSVARLIGVGIICGVGPFGPNLGLGFIFGLGAFLLVYTLIVRRMSDTARSVDEHRRVTILALGADIALILSVMLIFSPDAAWTVWAWGGVVVVGTGFRLGTAATMAVAVIFSLSYIGMSFLRDGLFGYSYVAPNHLANGVAFYLVTALVTSGIVREIRGLQRNVQNHVREIERSATLRRYLPQQVAEEVIASGDESLLQTHRREITVVFGDLRGFTAFAETGEPEVVMRVLGEYHGAVGGALNQFGGTLGQFAGDGWLVYFNDPLPVPDHASQAVRMSVTLRERISELARQWQRHGYELEFGIGIAIGYATLGMVGYEGRHDYSAIGTVANLASRLADEAKGGQILVTRHVSMLVEQIAKAEPVGDLQLKGFLKPVSVLNIVALE